MTAGQNSPVFDFTSLDFNSVQSDLVAYAKRTYPDDLWTDFNDSNFATFLLQQQSYASDLLFYNANAAVLETVPATLVREQSMRDIGKTFDFTMKSASPSRADTLRIAELSNNPADYPLDLSTRFQFTSDEGIIFRPAAAYSFSYPTLWDPSFGNYADLSIIQGELHDGATGVGESLGTSNGTPGQRLSLASTSVIDDTISVISATDESGTGAEAYTQITNFIEAGPTERVFAVETDENLVSYILFGDNVNGRIPQDGRYILATYTTGGGTEGNYPSGTFLDITGAPGEALPNAILNGTPRAVLMTPAYGGGPRQSLSNAKIAFPATLKANERAVTDSDYAALALEVTGVLRAFAIPGRAIGGSTPVFLFIVPNDGDIPTIDLANQIVSYLKTYRMSGKRIYIKDPVYVNILIDADAYVLPKSSKLATSRRLKDLLLLMFAIENVNFAAEFVLQNIYTSTTDSNVDGLSSVYYRKFTIEPHYARYVKTPTTGTGFAANISVDWRLVKRREWYIKIMLSDPANGIMCSRFSVRQRAPGTVSFVTSSSIVDEVEAFSSNEFAGWYFHPIPEDLEDIYRRKITGNTGQTITVETNDLLSIVQPGDAYVVETDETAIGKVLRTTTNAAITSSTSVPVVSSYSFAINDKISLTDSSGAAYTRTVSGVPNSILFSGGTYIDGTPGDSITFQINGALADISIDLNGVTGGQTGYKNKLASSLSTYATVANESTNIRITLLQTGGAGGGKVSHLGGNAGNILGTVEEAPFVHYLVVNQAVTLQSSAYVDYLWTSADGSVSFSVVDGSTAFVAGDVFYVDTYPQVGDVRLRPEDFPLIVQDDVRINPIGGI